ncbi:MAG TPA: MFS transporter, partial [Ktedonobacterales bacterium]|nr:MFS transporter [Ktedonobacterales bacterium]
ANATLGDANQTSAPATRTKPGLLINRNFAALWSGQAISVVGDMVFTTTLVVWIAAQLARGQSWAPLAVSGVLVAAAIPAFLIGPFAGVFVDRLDKRRMMLWMDGLRVFIAAALILATGVVPLPFLPGGRLPLTWTLGAIYAIVFLVNAADQFFRPAMTALIGDLVPEAEQPKAIGLAQASVSIASIIGPAVAAPLFIAFGAQWALLINALSFLVSFATIAAIRAPRAATSVAPGARPNFARELGEGLRFYVRSRTLMTLLIAAGVVMLGAGAVNTLDIFFTTGNLHAPVSLYGFIGAVFGAGAIVGAILASMFAERLGVGRTLWMSLLLTGVAVVAVSRITSIGPALALFALVGCFITGVNVAVGPLLLRATPRELLGRVSSVITPAVNGATLVGAALAGYLDGDVLRTLHIVALGTTFGPVDTIYGVAGLLIVASAFVALVGLRGADQRTQA